jgi:PadR family transcriptional regulator PadR
MDDENTINKKFMKEMTSGVSSLVLLNALSQTKEPMYGYQIAKQLKAEEEETPVVKQGALYPVLRSLEKSGLLSSEVEPSVSGPPRRYYSITKLGRSTLATWNKIWSQTKNFVDRNVEGENNDN